MSPDVLKWLLSAIPITTMDLHRPVRSLTTESIRPIIAHRDIHPKLKFNLFMWHAIHLRCGLANQQAQHGALCCHLDDRELNALIVRERLAKWFAFVGVFDGFVDAVLGGTETRCCLPDSVLVHEGLRDSKTIVQRTDNLLFGNPYVGQRDSGVVGRHV